MSRTIYNPRINTYAMPMLRIVPLRRTGLLLALAMVSAILSMAAVATDWTVSVNDSAKRIAAAVKAGPVSLEVTNRSSVTAAEFVILAQDLRKQLTDAGLQLVDSGQSPTSLHISLSENLQEYLWIAQVEGSGGTSTIITPAPRPETAQKNPGMAQVVINRIPLWSQTDRILDVAVLEGAPTRLAVLSGDQLAIYRQQYGRWQLEQALAIVHEKTWPRDLRGRLSVGKVRTLEVNLPGVVCRSSANAPASMTCIDRDSPWPIGTEQFPLSAFFTPSRNYFSSVLVAEASKLHANTPFYSAAILPQGNSGLLIFAGIDGAIRIVDANRQIVQDLDSGSDIAAIHSGCGSGWQLLSTAAGKTGTDSIGAFELLDHKLAAVSSLLDFSGAITALWTDASGTNAIAVSHHAQTGEYEAFRLSLSCN